ncbi:MAG TPA: DUF2207 domain-containing protein [Allosphingosinicella sp.]|nr:DUF2207 domain-containing protein [Allosphingosinicella sp.]
MRRLLLPLLAALALLWPAAAAADERILHFLSDVAVQADGTLDVTETIRVRSEGVQIIRGILRDFPTRYRNRVGGEVRVGFEMLGVQRDGRDEPWTTMREGNGVRVRIGNPDIFLEPGEHVYAIRYRTTRQIGFFADYDELYWNATGTGWDFPIDVAEARIVLPRPVHFGNRSVYTGPQDSREANAEIVSESDGEIQFRTNVPLGAKEGLTVAVAWEKGVVAPPPPPSAARLWLQDNAPAAAGALGLLGLLFYYFHAWRRAGRDPKPGTIVPIFTPPDGLSAAAMRYIREMGADSRAFAAALVELGVGGHIRLSEEEGGFLRRDKTRIDKTEGRTILAEAEAAMMTRLFAGGDSLLMEQKNHATFSAAKQALEKQLKQEHEGRLFVRNRIWAVRGFVLMVAALALPAAIFLLTAPEDYGRYDILAAAAALLLPAAALGLYSLARGKGSAKAVAGKMLAAFLGVVGLVAGVVTVGNAVEGVVAYGELWRLVPLAVPLLALPVVLTAFWWMAAPTREGRAVLDRIEGFRHYLSVTEEERLETLHPPEKTPELFERYLPFAIALEVENDWASRFTSILAAAAAVPGQSQPMGWYSGSSDPWRDPGDFADSVGSSLASTISSASSAPGSSSGSGGGGSSGGGGGGGGGGGW